LGAVNGGTISGKVDVITEHTGIAVLKFVYSLIVQVMELLIFPVKYGVSILVGLHDLGCNVVVGFGMGIPLIICERDNAP
ncbi:hypothetical protein Tco_1505842, partial [Tanacetum coccineum]